jgi:hypothetical protein
MKTVLVSVSISAFQFLSISAFAQGSLTPTAAPTPTMKTLQQIEPRTEINATNTPGDSDSLYKITQPGSYYITGNITGVSGKHVIEIALPAGGPVTLDLMGFELVGVSGSLDGITASNDNVAIHNGTLRNWGGNGINVSGSNNLLSKLLLSSNGQSGMRVGRFGSVIDCTAYQNSSEGISADRCTIKNCAASFNFGAGIFGDEGVIVDRSTR